MPYFYFNSDMEQKLEIGNEPIYIKTKTDGNRSKGDEAALENKANLCFMVK